MRTAGEQGQCAPQTPGTPAKAVRLWTHTMQEGLAGRQQVSAAHTSSPTGGPTRGPEEWGSRSMWWPVPTSTQAAFQPQSNQCWRRVGWAACSEHGSWTVQLGREGLWKPCGHNRYRLSQELLDSPYCWSRAWRVKRSWEGQQSHHPRACKPAL